MRSMASKTVTKKELTQLELEEKRARIAAEVEKARADEEKNAKKKVAQASGSPSVVPKSPPTKKGAGVPVFNLSPKRTAVTNTTVEKTSEAKVEETEASTKTEKEVKDGTEENSEELDDSGSEFTFNEDAELPVMPDDLALSTNVAEEVLFQAESEENEVESEDLAETQASVEKTTGLPVFHFSNAWDYDFNETGHAIICDGQIFAITEDERVEFMSSMEDARRTVAAAKDWTLEEIMERVCKMEAVPKAETTVEASDPKTQRAKSLQKKFPKSAYPKSWWNMPPYLVILCILCIFNLFALSDAVTTDHMLRDVTFFLQNDFKTAANSILAETSFDTFGKMDSTVYRMMFHDIISSVSLDDVVMSIVILLTVMIKSKERIIRAINAIPNLKAIAEVAEAMDFIQNQCVTYVDPAGKKFPLVKLPESFCTISFVYFCAFNSSFTLTKLFECQWFGHLVLTPFLQDLHEMFMRFFWTQIVKKTRNKTKNRDKERSVGVFYSDIYENTVSDTYNFSTFNGVILNNPPKTLVQLIQLVNRIRTESSFTMTAMDPTASVLLPPRADWKFFHPRFSKDPSITTHDLFQATGDYNRASGIFDRNLTNGLLTDWMRTFNSSHLKAAPSETVIKKDDVETTYTHVP